MVISQIQTKATIYFASQLASRDQEICQSVVRKTSVGSEKVNHIDQIDYGHSVLSLSGHMYTDGIFPCQT